MNITLKVATATDVAELTRIAHEAKRHWKYSDELITQWSSALTIDPGSLVEMHVVIAEVSGSIEGFCGVLPGTPQYRLEHLWIRPRAMGRGFGRKLFEYAVDFARSKGASALVIESDPNAESFYVRMGARRIGAVSAPVRNHPNRVLTIFEISLRPMEGSHVLLEDNPLSN